MASACASSGRASRFIRVDAAPRRPYTHRVTLDGRVLLDRYEIVAPLGAGGMGTVYRGFDRRLRREVAVKVLKAHADASADARDRFLREARALSALNHPHICVLHDFGTEGELDFLVMELVEGVTLEARVEAGALGESEVLRIGAQMADALAYAHGRGVLHRDLKPANVLQNARGDVKVMDFGLARLLGPAADASPDLTRRPTETGFTLGTLRYMAPEQLLGRDIDARADLYALGVVLYELSTGRSPYRLDSSLVDEILHEPVPPPRTIDPALSSRLEAIVLRCLARDPRDRYGSAAELLADLQDPDRKVSGPRSAPRARRGRRAIVLAAAAAAVAVAAYVAIRQFAPVSGAIQTLAVLPLDNLSRDSTQSYFAEGMTDEIITRLSQIGALRVRPRGSVMAFRGSERPPHELGRALQVDAIVTGSVLEQGRRARISAQLVRTKDDVSLWADSFEGDLADVLTLQSQVAKAVAEKIRVKLTADERQRLGAARPVDPRAHEAYLRGLFAWGQITQSGFSNALAHFQDAIRIDPGYAPAYAGLAGAYSGMSSLYMPAREAMPRAKAAATRALALDPELAEAWDELAYVEAFYDWDWPRAETHLRRALELNPGSELIHENYAYFLRINARFAEALEQARRGMEIDPLSNNARQLMTIQLNARHFDEAIAIGQQQIRDHQDDYVIHMLLGQCWLGKRRFGEALPELARAKALERSPLTITWLGVGQAMAGHADTARAAIAELESDRTAFVESYFFAELYAALGDRDHAFEWLNRAIADRSEELCFVRFDPTMDGLRSDPRYLAVLRSLHFTPPPTTTLGARPAGAAPLSPARRA